MLHDAGLEECRAERLGGPVHDRRLRRIHRDGEIIERESGDRREDMLRGIPDDTIRGTVTIE
jgi:hypothetical protein